MKKTKNSEPEKAVQPACTFFSGLDFPCFGFRLNAVAGTEAFPRFYGLQYIHAGPLYLSVNGGTRYELEGPFAFLTSPDCVFSYGSPPGTTRQHYHVCVQGERVKSYLASGLFLPAAAREIPYVPIHAPDRFLADMLELILLLQYSEKHDFAVSRFEYMLLSMNNQGPGEKQVAFYQPALEQLARKIMTRPELDWNFPAEAAKLNISVKHFMRLFRELHGVPPVRFVLKQRLFKACTMLIRERGSIKSVAYECGFRNEFYFSHVFKKYMQCAPETYRNKNPYTRGVFRPGWEKPSED